MAQLVNAAKQLRQQVLDLHPKAKVEVLDEPDGLGFQRSIRLSPEVGKRLRPALELIMANDPRISEVVASSYGLRVTFVSTTKADWATEFPLAEVLAVLEDNQ